jgi:hypothetical protein
VNSTGTDILLGENVRGIEFTPVGAGAAGRLFNTTVDEFLMFTGADRRVDRAWTRP